MNDAQTWTLIGAFTAFVFGALTLTGTLTMRTVKSEIAGVRGEFAGFRGEFAGIRGEIAGLEGRISAQIERLDGRITVLDTKVDALAESTDRRLTHLESDVAVIKQHLFGAPAA